MTLKKYKNIDPFSKNDEIRGHRVSEKDRDIYERENVPIGFGRSSRDVIEFALYDTNDNMLGWKTKIQEQPIMLDYGSNQLNGRPPEAVMVPPDDMVSVGFHKGAFKLTYQFLHNRVGSNQISQGAFIQEISPSRTEVRILPALTGHEDTDAKLKRDFQHFKHNDLPNWDAIDIINRLFNSITVENVKSIFNDNFIFEFSYDFGVKGKDLEILQQDILDETQKILVMTLESEVDDYISLMRLSGLFKSVLSNVIDSKIPRI